MHAMHAGMRICEATLHVPVASVFSVTIKKTARTASAFQPAVLFHLMSDFNDFNGGRHHERIFGIIMAVARNNAIFLKLVAERYSIIHACNDGRRKI